MCVSGAIKWTRPANFSPRGHESQNPMEVAWLPIYLIDYLCEATKKNEKDAFSFVMFPPQANFGSVVAHTECTNAEMYYFVIFTTKRNNFWVQSEICPHGKICSPQFLWQISGMNKSYLSE